MEQNQNQRNELLKIMSYNIHSGRNIWMIPQLKYMIHLIKAEQPDIVGIQEINENRLRGLQISAFTKHLHMLNHFGPNVKIGNGYYGIATFTKLPIKDKEHTLFPSHREQRGFINTIVEANNGLINIINTHLSLNNTIRNKQLANLTQYVKALTEPIILMGDFNTVFAHFDDLLMDCGKEKRKEHLSTLMLSNKRIDYIFVSNHFKVINYQVVHSKMSDHYPVVVELIFNN